MPSMKVNTIFMGDRLGRGGDHTPFQWEGYAAVRISTPNEIYANQHHATDLLANMSVPYTAKVARVNLVVAANLALAPKPPIVMPEPRAGGGRQGARSRDRRHRRSRGRGGTPSRPDDRARPAATSAVLRWRAAGPEDDIKGYAIVIRPTTRPIGNRRSTSAK